MAVRTILVDDLDDSEEMVTTTTIALDGKAYEIDLSEKNRSKLQKALEPYIKKARMTGSRTVQKSGSKKKASRTDLPEVRAWAKEQGYEVAERGRVPKDVRDAYDARHRGVAA